MWFIYVLKSDMFDKFYIGKIDNLERRLSEHNIGKSKYSRRFMPWSIVYSEKLCTEGDAIKREKYLKSAAGRRWLKKKVDI